MLIKWLEFLKKQYLILSGILLAALLLLALPQWEPNKQSEAMSAEEREPAGKKHKSEQYVDVFLPTRETNRLHDPFLLPDKFVVTDVPKEANVIQKSVSSTEKETISLVGILRNEAKAKALVQLGTTMVSVEAGDHIAMYEVISIGEQEVVLQGAEDRLVLQFAKR